MIIYLNNGFAIMNIELLAGIQISSRINIYLQYILLSIKYQ